MKNTKQKLNRQKRTRGKVRGNQEKPRLSVFRSINYIYAQIIDDKSGKTIFGASEKNLKDIKGNKTERAKSLGKLIAEKALAKKTKKVVFDKGAYKYHGRVKALAEGAREGGLEF